MADNQRKHLEFIQAAIARMAQSSLLVKGWSITLTAALLALQAKDGNPRLAIIPLPAILLFWWLNAFFLSTEHRFRALFDQVRQKKEDQIDFSMDLSASTDGWTEPFKKMKAKTLWPFHGTLLCSAIASLVAGSLLPVESSKTNLCRCCFGNQSQETPQPVAPQPVAPQPVAPQPVAPQP